MMKYGRFSNFAGDFHLVLDDNIYLCSMGGQKNFLPEKGFKRPGRERGVNR
jgi:hypothetical protein